jgi:hypothetical protein
VVAGSGRAAGEHVWLLKRTDTRWKGVFSF